jgi:hypothetical protein
VGCRGTLRDVSDDELIEYAKVAVGREHGLTEAQACRLVGSSLKELHADAATMAGELGVEDPYQPEPGRARDDAGRFAGSAGMNAIIRKASGRQ